MKNITDIFKDLYTPVKALLIYINAQKDDFYVECHDLDSGGRATNIHPLSVREADSLVKALGKASKNGSHFLKCKGMLSKNILYIDQSADGQVMWHTPLRKTNIFFKSELGIADGQAEVPPMLWRASKTMLHVWALKSDERPSPKSILYKAPFFNIYTDGKVCLGNVAVKIPDGCNMEEFITLWEHYFFSSRFSHLLADQSPVKDNIVQLWQSLVGTKKKFPVNALLKTNQTLKNLMP